ncbi:MAG: ATP-binding protein [Candidatus Scalinduaceae bacterium]
MIDEEKIINSIKNKKRHFFKSIRFKFICWFLITSLVPLFIVGMIAYFYSKDLATKRVLEHLTSVTDSRKEHLKTFLKAKEGRTIDFSSDGFIRDITKKVVKGIEPHHDIESSIKMLNTHLANNKVPLCEDIFETFIINLDGIIISSSNELSIGIDVSRSDYFQEGKKGVYTSQIYHVPVVGTKRPQVSGLPLSYSRNFIAVAAPLKDKTTFELIGVLINKINPDTLNNITTKRNGLGESGEVYLVNMDKLMITESRFRKDCILKQKVDTIGVRNCISGNDGIGIYDDYRGVPVIGSYAWIEEPGWALMTEVDVTEAFASLRKIRNLIIIVTIPMLLTVIGVSFFISTKISKPIITITDAIKRITSGELEHEISVSTNDELGQISNELGKIEFQIKESYKKLLHSERLVSVGRIAAGVAHEVNNPLSVLSGRLQLLIERCTDNTLSEEYEKLLYLANRIEKTVDGLLYFSRQKDMDLAYVDLNTVIEDSISLIERQMYANGIKIIKRYESNLPPVKISTNQIQQVFFNIVLNAFDSMVDKGNLTICTRSCDDGKKVRTTFEDTGGGIPAKDIDKIFEPFFTTKPPRKGTGLGLSISYGIIRNHNGTINVESEEGKGTKFMIDLPVKEIN